MFWVQRLPDELVCHTFESLGPDALDALAISHVDRRWRELSLKIPRLWTSLDLRLGSQSAHAFARRSGDLRLHIQVFHRSTDYVGAKADAIHMFMDAATAYFARWSTLTIDVISVHAVEMVLDRCRGVPDVVACRENRLPLSLMASVILRVHKAFAEDKNGYPRGFIAPFHPRHFVLDGIAAWDQGFCSHALERMELRNLPLYTRGIRLDFLTEVLRACPNLQELVLDDTGLRSPLDDPRPVELQHLQALTICNAPAAIVRSLLSLLSIPILQSLHLHIHDTLADLSRCLATFSDKTAITQMHIACSALRTHPAQIMMNTIAWENFPELNVLVLDGTGIDDQAVAALSALPKLQHLGLRYEISASPAAVESLLHARLRNERASALRKLDIYLCKQFSIEAMSRPSGKPVCN